jgi:hypothetical protein
MDGGVLFFAMLSGWMALTNGAYDALLWPLSKTMCRSGQKMTTHIGCQDLDAEPTGPAGRTVSSACSVLCVCAAWVLAGTMEASLLSVACCAVVLIAGIVQGGIRQPAPQRQPSGTLKKERQ